MKDSKRVCLIDGTWQLIMLRAALCTHGIFDHTKTIIALHSRSGNSDHAVNILKYARSLFPAAQYIALDSENLKIPEMLSNNGNIQETWVNFLNDPIERRFRVIYPQAKLFLYEDGFGLYALDEKIELKDRIVLYARKLFIELSSREGLARITSNLTGRLLERNKTTSKEIFATYLFLDEMLGKPSFTKGVNSLSVSREYLFDTLEQLRLSIGNNILLNGATDKDTVLFVAQNFFDHGQMSFDQELEIYIKAVKKLLIMGYRVLWKDHPKVSRQFGPLIQSAFLTGSIKIYDFPSHLPVELVGHALNGPVVGVTSTSLFYLKLLYQVMTYHICNELDDVFFGSKRGMQRIIRKKIPSYSEMTVLK